jgi:hypothetical protein
VAIAGLVVLHFDAERIFRRLTQGEALPALVLSVIAGIVTLALVWRRRYEPARYTAALAVAAIIAGWAVAQNPVFLHGLTVRQAAAGHDTLVAVVVAVLAGAVLLFPALARAKRTISGAASRREAERPTRSCLARCRHRVSDDRPRRLGSRYRRCLLLRIHPRGVSGCAAGRRHRRRGLTPLRRHQPVRRK